MAAAPAPPSRPCKPAIQPRPNARLPHPMLLKQTAISTSRPCLRGAAQAPAWAPPSGRATSRSGERPPGLTGGTVSASRRLSGNRKFSMAEKTTRSRSAHGCRKAARSRSRGRRTRAKPGDDRGIRAGGHGRSGEGVSSMTMIRRHGTNDPRGSAARTRKPARAQARLATALSRLRTLEGQGGADHRRRQRHRPRGRALCSPAKAPTSPSSISASMTMPPRPSRSSRRKGRRAITIRRRPRRQALLRRCGQADHRSARPARHPRQQCRRAAL